MKTEKIQELNEPEINNSAEEKLLKELTLELTGSLYLFSKHILDTKPIVRHAHKNLCLFVEDKYIEGDDTQVKPFKLILMPRGSLKTTLITNNYSIQQIILNPNIRILIASETYANAKFYVRQIKEIFETNETLKNLYGDFVGETSWRDEWFIVSTRTRPQREPTVSAGGVDQTKVGMHYDLIICDDLVSQNNIQTKDQMQKVQNFYSLALSLLEPNGKMIVVGTRWAYYDLYNHIIENERHKFNVFKRSAINEDGSLFYPERLSAEFLNDMKISQGSFIFSAQYLNETLNDENAIIKKDWIRYYNKDDIPPKEKMNIYLTCDPAISKTGDYTAIVVCGVDEKNIVYVLYAKRFRLTDIQIINKVLDIARYYNPLKVGIETTVFQAILKTNLLEEMRKRKEYYNIVELKTPPNQRKEFRILGLAPRFEAGDIFIDKTMTDLEDELIRFSLNVRQKNDDLIDALAHQLKLWTRFSFIERIKEPMGSFKQIMRRMKKTDGANDFIGNQKISSGVI